MKKQVFSANVNKVTMEALVGDLATAEKDGRIVRLQTGEGKAQMEVQNVTVLRESDGAFPRPVFVFHGQLSAVTIDGLYNGEDVDFVNAILERVPMHVVYKPKEEEIAKLIPLGLFEQDFEHRVQRMLMHEAHETLVLDVDTPASMYVLDNDYGRVVYSDYAVNGEQYTWADAIEIRKGRASDLFGSQYKFLSNRDAVYASYNDVSGLLQESEVQRLIKEDKAVDLMENARLQERVADAFTLNSQYIKHELQDTYGYEDLDSLKPYKPVETKAMEPIEKPVVENVEEVVVEEPENVTPAWVGLNASMAPEGAEVPDVEVVYPPEAVEEAKEATEVRQLIDEALEGHTTEGFSLNHKQGIKRPNHNLKHEHKRVEIPVEKPELPKEEPELDF